MIWDIVVAKIEAAGLGRSGETIFRDTIPADKKVAIGLYEPLQGITVSPHLPHYYKPELKIIVRHNKVGEGRALANALMKLLTIEGEEFYEANDERGEAMLKVFFPRALPIQFPSSVGNLTEWAVNFQTAFVVKPL